MKPLSRSIYRAILTISLATVAAPHLSGAPQDKKKDPEQIGNRGVGAGLNLYSLERELALGRQLAQEVEREARMIENPHAAEFVNRVAQNLARNSDAKVPVTARVIDSNEVNAFALPGGFLFVNTGLIVEAENEAELASALAHEIAHVAARHGTRQSSRGEVAQIASLPLIFLGGWAGLAARQGSGLAIPLTFLKFSRGFEREADMLGLQYLYKSGYDPLAAVDFLERIEALERKKPGTLSDLFRSHPKTSDRIKAIQQDIRDLLKPRPLYVVSTAEFAAVRQELKHAQARRKPDPAGTGPTLRRPSERGTEPADGKGASDERPALRRK
ncbi:MAG TPA: M48 family metallopeptidase [Bryobacteraceae bacterium]|nr:M48 family metallopeptidase [Bryobacteraceae bacterium]